MEDDAADFVGEQLQTLVGDLERVVMGQPAVQCLRRRGIDVTVARQAVRGVRHLLEGDADAAAQAFEAAAEELRDRTMTL